MVDSPHPLYSLSSYFNKLPIVGSLTCEFDIVADLAYMDHKSPLGRAKEPTPSGTECGNTDLIERSRDLRGRGSFVTE
jgi:hypothetical protein